jgi:DNA-binding transcriptional LysR family regulator
MFSLDDAALFAKVVDCGGFSAPARVTGHPKSTLSKRIALLEEALGVRLLNRNARGLSHRRGQLPAVRATADALGAALRARLAVLAAVAPAGVAPTAVDSDSRRSSGDPPGLAA